MLFFLMEPQITHAILKITKIDKAFQGPLIILSPNHKIIIQLTSTSSSISQ